MSSRASALRSPRRHVPRGPSLRVVKRRRSRNLIKRARASKNLSIAVVTGIGVASIIAIILLEQVVLVQSSFRLTEIRENLVAQQERREVLLLEAAKLDSSARIESYAREVLGMVDPTPAEVQYIVADVRQPGRAPARARGSKRDEISAEGVAAGDIAGGLGEGP